jgi:integrase
MPKPRKDHVRILPPVGSKSWPAYVVKRDGVADRFRYVIQKPGAAPENVDADTLADIKIMRARSERTLVEHEQLTFDKAIALYMATFVVPSGTRQGTNRTKEGRLRAIFEPVLDLACPRLTPERGYSLYMGKVAPKLGADGKPIIIEAGYIHRNTKKPRRAAAAGVAPDRSGRGPGLISGRYQGIGPRFQRCQQCGEVGHNRRAHRGQPEVAPLPAEDEARFSPPSVATHQAALKEAKKFMDWLGREGFITLDKNGHHALSHVKPFGHKSDDGFGKAKLTDEELIALDRACIFILTNLPTLPEEVRLAWQQRAVAVLLALRCGARTGEVLTARRRQFKIIPKACAALDPPCEVDHGGHVGGLLQVIRESAKTKTSVRDLPIAPALMAHVLPLLEGKHMEHFFLAGAPRGRTGWGMAGANWERDPSVGLSKRWLANSVVKLCEIAGVRKVNPHSLRGNFVDSRIKRGDPFAEVSRSAGHGKTKTTERHYASERVLAESDQRRMRERLGYENDDGRN